MIGKVDIINQIEKGKIVNKTYCFEVILKGDYESLHMLSSVTGSLVKKSRL